MNLPPEGTYGIRTNDGHYLTAVNGGGLEGAAIETSTGLWFPAVLSSNATEPGSFGTTFTWVWLEPQGNFSRGSFALQTATGNYVTAVNGGGLGGSNDEGCPFHTDATNYSTWEHFYIVHVDESQQQIALRTATGNYVTAVNGGGIGGPNESPCTLHTDATWKRAWETFTI
jgi:hypothetical protein